jgi:hypothetical protein
MGFYLWICFGKPATKGDEFFGVFGRIPNRCLITGKSERIGPIIDARSA